MDANTPISPGQSPDSQVADLITEQLVETGLIHPNQAGNVFRGLADGSLKAADWRLIAEIAVETEARHGETAC